MPSTSEDVGTRPVLLTGASGLLGTWLWRSAPDPGALVALIHRNVVADLPTVRADLRDRDATVAAVRAAAPSLIIHTAYDKDRASIVDATRHLTEAAADVGADVVFTSTDAVFSGDGMARDEAATPDPGADYGRSKAEAEQIVHGASETATIVRLPLLVSVDPDDHVVRQIRAAAANGEATAWYDDEIRRPAMASEIAAALWRIVALPPAERRGVWHLAGVDRLSRFMIARLVANRLGLAPTAVQGGPTPEGSDRPRDLEFTDERARAAIAWNPSPILSWAIAAVLVAVLALAGCGSGSKAPDQGLASSTTTIATTTTTTTTTVGANSIPTDPSVLGACRDLPTDVLAASPSRRWVTVPDGWEVRYAYTSAEVPVADPLTTRWSSLVQTDGSDSISAIVNLDQADPAEGTDWPGSRPVTLREVPAAIGPEVTRGGASGSTRVTWTEGGSGYAATARGLDDDALLSVLTQLELTDGRVSSVPAGWTVVGSATTVGAPNATVLGLAEKGEPLLETSYAPVEIIVDEPTSGAAGTGGFRAPVFDPASTQLRLLDIAGRPAVTAALGDGQNLARTTDADGHATSASGSLPAGELAALAASARPVDLDDPELAGIPMGAEGSSAGTWCRGPR